MKRLFAFFIIFLIICFVLFFGQGCKILQKKEFYFEIAKVFSEQNIQKLFKLDTFQFKTVRNIDIQRTLPTAKIVDLIGNKLASKITSNGQASFENEKVQTFVFWKTENDSTTIRYFRKVK